MDQKTIQTYNKFAREYDAKVADFFENILPKTFTNKFFKLAKGRVLNIGSGSGLDGLILKKAGFEVTCIDASKEMVKISSERGLDSVLGDFMDLPFIDQSFDSVWAYTSLLHVTKKEIVEALGEVKRVLKNNGVFALGMIESETEEYRTHLGNSPRLFSYYNKIELENLLKANGFEITYFESFKPKSKNYLNFIAKKVSVAY